MTKDVLALALEAMELSSITVDNFTVQAKCQDAIAAIKQAQAIAFESRLTDEQKEWVTDNPNTNDLVEFIEAFAHRAALLAVAQKQAEPSKKP